MGTPRPCHGLQRLPSALLLALGLASSAAAQGLVQDEGLFLRPDDEPPVGVLGAAAAAAGDLTFTWNWEGVERSGVRVGDEAGALADATGDPAAPTALGAVRSARAEVHRFGVHFELKEGLDLDFVMPYRDARLQAVDTQSGDRFEQRANGLGDLEIGALWSEAQSDGDTLTYGMAVTLPTGSTDEKGGVDEQLPYFLQPGAGAWSFIPRAYVVGRTDEWSWGYGGHYTARLGVGGEDWHKGNELELGAWASNRLNRDTSISLRFEATHRDGVSGTDDRIEDPLGDGSPPPTNFHDASNTGGTLVRLYGGLNYVGTRGNRFALEIGVPLHEDVRGVQVSTGITYGLGWRYGF